MAALAVLGVVAKPFGVRGEVFVRPDPDLDHDFPPGAHYKAGRSGSDADRELVVATSQLHSGRRVVGFEGVGSREAAEALRGLELRVDREAVPLDDDTWWVDDLLGRDVVDANGDLVGVLEAVADGPAHDYFVVARPDGGELLIPVVDEFVEVEADRIVITPPPGLLEL